ncbi:MAG: hypothetical protein OXI16_13535 [Chloroflexota bacterium]|nr:hypothetical protein [Chloroflexota bacterium]
MNDVPVLAYEGLLVERFIEEHCEELGEGYIGFRDGHHPDELNLIADCRALKLTLPDDERHILVFPDGSNLFYDDTSDAVMAHSAKELVWELMDILDREIAGAAAAKRETGKSPG